MPTLSEIRAAVRGADVNHTVTVANEIAVNYGSSRVLEFFESLNRMEDLFICDWSDEIAHIRSRMTIGDDQTISLSSFEESGFWCHLCNCATHRDNGNPFDGGMYRVCGSCVSGQDLIWSGSSYETGPDDDEDQEDDDNLPYVLGYSVNPISNFPSASCFKGAEGETLPLKPRWLGVELEVEPKDSARAAAIATHEAVGSFAIMKRDASIAADGFEIVTVPATLRAHREMWKPFFKGPAKRLKSWNTNGACGMHVHISRASLSNLTLGCMLVFVNDKSTRSFIEMVAGRGSVEYSRIHKKVVTDALCSRSAKNRYEALNVRDSLATVELRIFRGNVSENGFFKNLDFTDALVAFCTDASYSDLRVETFLKWLAEPANRKTYFYLTAWAVHRGLLKVKTNRDASLKLVAA